MTFAQNDTHRMIESTVERLLAAENSFDIRQHRAPFTQQSRTRLWSLLGEQGVLEALFPESLGGYGGAIRDVAVIMAAAGAWLVTEPILNTALCARILADGANPAALQTQIAAIRCGRSVVAFAHTERATPFGLPHTFAAPDGASFRLSGRKVAIRHGDSADLLIVSAVLEGEPACFLVETRNALEHQERFRQIDGSFAATVTLEACPGQLLVQGPSAQAAISAAMDLWLVGLASETTGILIRLNGATFQYLQTRKQFGVPLASFQALQHRAADMHIACEQARAVTALAIEAVESDAPSRSALASAAKAISDEAGRTVSHDAAQMHGGMGVSDELEISHYLRRLAAIRAEAGNAQLHRERFAAALRKDAHAGV